MGKKALFGALVAVVFSGIVPGQSLSVVVEPAQLVVKSGTDAAIRVVVQGAKTGDVALGMSGVPAGVTSSFAPAALTGSGESELRIRAAAAVKAGKYELKITAKQGGVSAERTFELEISASADFKLQAAVPVLRLIRGKATGLAKIEDYPGARTQTQITVASAPAGVTVMLAKAALTGAGDVAFEVTGTQAVAKGRHVIRLSAASNAVSKTLEYQLVVEAPRYQVTTAGRARSLKRGGTIREPGDGEVGGGVRGSGAFPGWPATGRSDGEVHAGDGEGRGRDGDDADGGRGCEGGEGRDRSDRG